MKKQETLPQVAVRRQLIVKIVSAEPTTTNALYRDITTLIATSTVGGIKINEKKNPSNEKQPQTITNR